MDTGDMTTREIDLEIKEIIDRYVDGTKTEADKSRLEVLSVMKIERLMPRRIKQRRNSHRYHC